MPTPVDFHAAFVATLVVNPMFKYPVDLHLKSRQRGNNGAEKSFSFASLSRINAHLAIHFGNLSSLLFARSAERLLVSGGNRRENPTIDLLLPFYLKI